MKKLFLLLVLTVCLAGTASANLLQNGDFEMLDDRVGLVNGYALNDLAPNRWDVYNGLPGGWVVGQGAGIEVQHNTVTAAHSPNHYVELDSHANRQLGSLTNSGMYQYFNVITAGVYDLSFWYKPRTNTVNDNGIEVALHGWYNDILTVNEVAATLPDWTEYTVSLGYLYEGLVGVGFRAIGLENSLGGFLDDISVNPVPEPATMALFGIGLLGLAGVSRRKKD